MAPGEAGRYSREGGAVAPGCDGCTLCCTVLGVEEIEKVRGHACRYIDTVGCSVHRSRIGRDGMVQPESCALFVCGWLASQSLPPARRMSPTMRPDRCGVVLGPIDEDNPRKLHVNVDPTRPDSWTDREVLTWLDRYVANGVEVVLYVGDEASATLRKKVK